MKKGDENSDWVIGNLTREDVRSVYRGKQREDFLRRASDLRYGPELFQPFGRSVRLGRIAKAVHQLVLVDEDLEAIRKKVRDVPRLRRLGLEPLLSGKAISRSLWQDTFDQLAPEFELGTPHRSS